MKWMKGLKKFGVAGGALILSVASVTLAVILTGIIQMLFRMGFQPEMFLGEEFAGLFAASGLRLNRIVPTSRPICVIEAVPA